MSTSATGHLAVIDGFAITAETITEEQIQSLEPYADEWVRAHGRELRLSFWIFDALHSNHDALKARARKVCADFMNGSLSCTEPAPKTDGAE